MQGLARKKSLGGSSSQATLQPSASNSSLTSNASNASSFSRGANSQNSDAFTDKINPPLDASSFDFTGVTSPLEHARILEIYDRKVEALTSFQEALGMYAAKAQPGQPPELPPHFRYYLGSCLRAAGDEMTALEFFSQQIAIYQSQLKLLVASEDPSVLAQPPRWFNSSSLPWAVMVGAYTSEDATPAAFLWHSYRGHLMLCLFERHLIFKTLSLEAAHIEDQETLNALLCNPTWFNFNPAAADSTTSFSNSNELSDAHKIAKQDGLLLMAAICLGHGKLQFALELIHRSLAIDGVNDEFAKYNPDKIDSASLSPSDSAHDSSSQPTNRHRTDCLAMLALYHRLTGKHDLADEYSLQSLTVYPNLAPPKPFKDSSSSLSQVDPDFKLSSSSSSSHQQQHSDHRSSDLGQSSGAPRSSSPSLPFSHSDSSFPPVASSSHATISVIPPATVLEQSDAHPVMASNDSSRPQLSEQSVLLQLPRASSSASKSHHSSSSSSNCSSRAHSPDHSETQSNHSSTISVLSTSAQASANTSRQSSKIPPPLIIDSPESNSSAVSISSHDAHAPPKSTFSPTPSIPQTLRKVQMVPSIDYHSHFQGLIVHCMPSVRPAVAKLNAEWFKTRIDRLTGALQNCTVEDMRTAELLFRRANLLLIAGSLPLALRDFGALLFQPHLEFIPPVFSAFAIQSSFDRIKSSLPPPAPKSVLALLSGNPFDQNKNEDIGAGSGTVDGTSLLGGSATVTPSASSSSANAVTPRDAHNPALDLGFSLAVFEPLAFATEGLTFMLAYYTELLIQHGPSARVYWYRANIHKLLHMLPEFIADLERMHLCDSTFLRRYLNMYDARYDFCDENSMTFVQWTLVLQVYRTRKLLASQQSKNRQRRSGLAAMKNTSQAAVALARFGQERRVSPDVVAVLQLLRQYYTLILSYDGGSLNQSDKSACYAFRGETWRQQGDIVRALADYSKARTLEVHQVVACTGQALCHLQKLDVEAAAEACLAGMRAIRMSFLKQPATPEQIAAAPKSLALNAATMETWKTACPFIFLQRPLLTGTSQPYVLKHAFAEFEMQEAVKEQLEKDAAALSRSDKLVLSMQIRHIAILVTVQSMVYQHMGEPYIAESLLKVAIEADRQCPLTRTQAMFFELRFGNMLEALKHLRVLMKVLPFADVCSSSNLVWIYRLPSWLKEVPRFWKGCYLAYYGKAGSATASSRAKMLASLAVISQSISQHPILSQISEYFDITLDNLADNDMRAAALSLENACKLDMQFPLVAGVRKFYKDNVPTIMPSSALANSMAIDENRLGLVEDSNGQIMYAAESPEDRYSRHSWELLARGKKFEEVFSYETFAFIDYTVALRIARFGEIHWRRGLLLRRKGNGESALHDVGFAIDFLQQRVKENEDLFQQLSAQQQQQQQSLNQSTVTAESADSKSSGNDSLPKTGDSNSSTSTASSNVPVVRSPIANILSRKLEMYIVVRGAIEYSLKDYETAIADFTRVLSTDPSNPEAFQQRSLAYTQLGRYELALEDLDRYCASRPDDLGSLLRLANLYSHTKFYSEAMSLYSRILQIAPGSPQILYGIGVTHFRRREWDAAELHFKLFLKKSRVSFPTAQLRLAEVYERQGRYGEALSAILSLKEQQYNLRRLYQCLGRVHLCLHNYRHAQEAFMVAIQQDESDLISLFLHSVVCFELGEIDSCLKDLSKLLEADHKHIEGNFMRGWIFMHDADYANALEYFERVITQQRTHVLAIQCRSYCLVFLGQLERAGRDCNRLLAVSQSQSFIQSFQFVSTTLTAAQAAARSTAATLVLRAFIFTLLGRYEAALHDLNRALETDKESPLLHLYRAECMRHTGSPDEAIRSYRLCIELLNRNLQQTAIASSTVAMAINDIGIKEEDARTQFKQTALASKAIASPRSDKNATQLLDADGNLHFTESEARARLECIDSVHKNRLRMEGRFNLNRADLASIHNMMGKLLYESALEMGPPPPFPAYFAKAPPSNPMPTPPAAAVANPAASTSLILARRAARRSSTASVDPSSSHNPKSSSSGDLRDPGLGNPRAMKVRQALEHFDLAIAHSTPHSLAAAHCNKGMIFLDCGLFDEALAELTTAISRDQAGPDVINNFGVALDQSGQYQKALDTFRSASDANPTHSLLAYNIGTVLAVRFHRWDEAIRVLTQFLRVPHDALVVAKALNNRSVCHINLRMAAASLLDLDKSLMLVQASEHAIFNRAHVHLALNDVWSAIQDIQAELSRAGIDKKKLVKQHRLQLQQQMRQKQGTSLLLDFDGSSKDKQSSESDKSKSIFVENNPNEHHEQNHRRSDESKQYLIDLYHFCKRWEWGQAVGCREMAIGLAALPVLCEIAVPDDVNAVDTINISDSTDVSMDFADEDDDASDVNGDIQRGEANKKPHPASLSQTAHQRLIEFHRRLEKTRIKNEAAAAAGEHYSIPDEDLITHTSLPAEPVLPTTCFNPFELFEKLSPEIHSLLQIHINDADSSSAIFATTDSPYEDDPKSAPMQSISLRRLISVITPLQVEDTYPESPPVLAIPSPIVHSSTSEISSLAAAVFGVSPVLSNVPNSNIRRSSLLLGSSEWSGQRAVPSLNLRLLGQERDASAQIPSPKRMKNLAFTRIQDLLSQAFVLFRRARMTIPSTNRSVTISSIVSATPASTSSGVSAEQLSNKSTMDDSSNTFVISPSSNSTPLNSARKKSVLKSESSLSSTANPGTSSPSIEQRIYLKYSQMNDAKRNLEDQVLDLLLKALYCIPTGRDRFDRSLLGRDYAEAEEYLQEYAELREIILLWRGRILLERGELTTRKSKSVQAGSANRRQTEEKDELISDEMIQVAMHDVKLIVDHSPTFIAQDHVIWTFLGLLEFQSGDLISARQTFGRAMQIDPMAVFPLLNAAAVDVHLKRYSHAMKSYRMLLDVIGYHTGKRGHPMLMGFSTQDSSLIVATTGPNSASSSVPISPVSSSIIRSPLLTPKSPSALKSPSFTSANKNVIASATGAFTMAKRGPLLISADQSSGKSAPQPIHSSLSTSAASSASSSQFSSSMGHRAREPSEIDDSWKMSAFQYDIYDALKQYGDILGMRPAHGWPSISKAQGALARALIVFEKHKADQERQRRFGSAMSATKSTHSDMLATVELYLDHLRQTDDVTSISSIHQNEQLLNSAFNGLLKNLTTKPSLKHLNLRELVAEESLKAAASSASKQSSS